MREIKTLSMYLPQFHRTPENDAWWGDGFTEWTAVKAAKPLFEGHMQPKIPINKNYYNLLEKSTMKTQVELMKKYGIDGQCFYHYYFKDGRKILEKPAENLLKWKDVDMSFCFCWANSSWSRTWSKIRGNSWADKFEKKEKGNGILLEQKYGRENEWKTHFEYMLPFFKDKRYIRLNERPVLMITNPLEIACLRPMIDYWDELAIENGINKLYIIGIGWGQQGLDAILLHSPHMFWNLNLIENGVCRPDYGETWEQIISSTKIEGYRTYFEGVVNCDDTPRRGCNGSVAFRNFCVKTFREGMYELYKKSIALENEFVFINAWNEWGEGMYLEPDEENGYAYLEAVQNAKQAAINENVLNEYYDSKIVEYPLKREVSDRSQKYQLMVQCLDKWLNLKEQGRNVGEFLVRNGIKTIAIYGMGVFGKHLLNDLEGGDVKVKYIIDRKKQVYHCNYEVKGLNDDFSQVDAIIITPLGEFDKIYNDLKRKVKYKLFSIMELISEL